MRPVATAGSASHRMTSVDASIRRQSRSPSLPSQETYVSTSHSPMSESRQREEADRAGNTATSQTPASWQRTSLPEPVLELMAALRKRIGD